MGAFINHEGGDGSGKATQTKLTVEAFQSYGFEVGVQAFPRYETPTGQRVRQYLRGELSHLTTKEQAQLYADDRLAAKPEMMPYIENPNAIQVTDRFTSSNVAHMGSHVLDIVQRHAFYEYIRTNEHEVMGIPKPDFNVILMIPAARSIENIRARNEAEGKVNHKDIHEEVEHLERAHAAYAELAQLYTGEYGIINCMASHSKMRSIEDIHEEKMELIQRRLGL